MVERRDRPIWLRDDDDDAKNPDDDDDDDDVKNRLID